MEILYIAESFTNPSLRIKYLKSNPFLGKQTDDPSIRVLITGDYEILYEILDELLLIVMIWDSRRDPEEKAISARKI